MEQKSIGGESSGSFSTASSGSYSKEKEASINRRQTACSSKIYLFGDSSDHRERSRSLHPQLHRSLWSSLSLCRREYWLVQLSLLFPLLCFHDILFYWFLDRVERLFFARPEHDNPTAGQLDRHFPGRLFGCAHDHSRWHGFVPCATHLSQFNDQRTH